MAVCPRANLSASLSLSLLLCKMEMLRVPVQLGCRREEMAEHAGSAHSRAQLQAAESSTLGVGPSHLQTDKCARWLQCVLKFENHCATALSAMLGTEWVLISHEKEKKGVHPPLHRRVG